MSKLSTTVIVLLMLLGAVIAQSASLLSEKKQQLADVERVIIDTKSLIKGATDFGDNELQVKYLKQKNEQLVELSELRNLLQYEVDFLSRPSSKQNGMIINSVEKPIISNDIKVVADEAKALAEKQQAEAKAAAEKKAKEEVEAKAAAEKKAAESKALAEKQQAEAKVAEAKAAAEKKAKEEAEAKAAAEKKAATEKKAKEEAEKKAAESKALAEKQQAEAKVAAEKKAKEEAEKKNQYTIEAACDNSYRLYINNNQVLSGNDWSTKQKTTTTLKSGDMIQVFAKDEDALGGLLVEIYNANGSDYSTGVGSWKCKAGLVDYNTPGSPYTSWSSGVKAPYAENYGVTKRSRSTWIWTSKQQAGHVTCVVRIN